MDDPAEEAGEADGCHEDGEVEVFLEFVGRSEVGDWEVEGYVNEETDYVFCCCCGTFGRLLVGVSYLEREGGREERCRTYLSGRVFFRLWNPGMTAPMSSVTASPPL